MTMRERIENGRLYTDMCEGLPQERALCGQYVRMLNQTTPFEIEERLLAMEKLFGKQVAAWIDPPFYCSYGKNISIGAESCIGSNCNFVDDGRITIGERVIIDPAVTITTVGRPLHPDLRGYMYAAQVTIGNNCHMGANVTVCPGVTVGENSVIAAGSVVTEDIPANCYAAGNPCRVIRPLDAHDERFYFHDRPILKEDLEEESLLRRDGMVCG